MIYLDTSVLLAQLLAEDRKPPATLWSQPLISSRLLEYETWTRLHARNIAGSHSEAARDLLARVSFVEMSPVVLERATEPFPGPVRILGALHLASVLFLGDRGQKVELATFDQRMLQIAGKLDIPLVDLGSRTTVPGR